MSKISTGHAVAKFGFVVVLSIALVIVLSFGSGHIANSQTQVAPAVEDEVLPALAEVVHLNSTEAISEGPIEVGE